MSLTLYVYKIRPAGKKSIDEGTYFHMYDEDKNEDSQFNFPKWAVKYEEPMEQEFYDWEEYKERTGITIQELIDYEIVDGQEILKVKDTNGNETEINLKDVKTFTKTVNVIGYLQISCCSHVYNEQFYDDIENGLVDKFIWTRDKLIEIMEKYCQDDDCGYSFKEKFKKDIIDEFEEGRMCVYVSW